MPGPISEMLGLKGKQADVKPVSKVDDTVETVRSFQEKIAIAQADNCEWVETSPEVIAHFNPRGMNGADFFIYHGIKVCEFGKAEYLDRKMNTPLGTIFHGDSEAIRAGDIPEKTKKLK